VDRRELVQKYLEYQDSGRVDELLGLLSDDIVLVYPMGTSSSKAQVEQALRARPGAFKPEYGEIEVEGDRAKVSGKLPPGMPISAVNLSFGFSGDLISRIEISMS
jgi:hypothetical protein